MDWVPTISAQAGPLYRQIAEAIEGDIVSGRLRRDEQLPTHRALALALGIDLTTVTRAYAEARGRGLLEGRVGQGTFGSESSLRPPALTPDVIDVDLSMNVPPQPAEAALDSRIVQSLAAIERRAGFSPFLNYQRPGGGEAELEQAMFRALDGQTKLPGKTVLLVDVSGSMDAPLSRRSEMRRNDAAYGLAVLLREIAEQVSVYSFSDELVRVPSRQGFALRDAINSSQRHNGTYLGKALSGIHEKEAPYDRLIVITDEQSHDPVPNPKALGYMINVASYQNGVGYGRWTHIDGWSDSVIEYIRAAEPMLQ